MRKISLVLFALILSRAVFPQGINLPSFYSQRELRAPLAVKNQLALIRKDIAAKNLKYQVGYTSVAEVPLEKITGFRPPSPDLERRLKEKPKPKPDLSIIAGNVTEVITDVKVLGEMPWPGNPYVFGNPSQSRLDLRQAGFVTPVRDQGLWGSCWAFSAMAAYESSYKILTKKDINTSEEYVVNCSGAGDWGGGWMVLVFKWMTDNQKNVADETALPYTGPPMACPSGSPEANYYAAEWGQVDPTKPLNIVPSVSLMKEAICRYGAISTALSVTESFKLYVGGVFYQAGSVSGQLNHGVAIIGWDDSIQCWLIKNSWGTGWGSECGYGTDRGYMWIKYDSSNIGCHAIWIRASTIIHN
ncbi:MAG TPA: C1 family peptidase [Chitinophagaceae bacterium]|nr:C1 family peptidase [Chitinophagaceae bacterium]